MGAVCIQGPYSPIRSSTRRARKLRTPVSQHDEELERSVAQVVVEFEGRQAAGVAVSLQGLAQLEAGGEVDADLERAHSEFYPGFANTTEN